MCVSLLSMAPMGADAVAAGGNLQVVAGGLNALGDLASGMTRSRMNKADANAELAYGLSKAQRIRTAGERELGTARAQAGASGVKVSSGSVLEAERQIVHNVEQDAGVAMLTAERRADALRQSADYYQSAGINSAADSLLGAVDKWKRTRRPQPDGGKPLIDYTNPTPQAGY